MIVDCAPPAVDGAQVQVGVRSFGRELGGLGIVNLGAEAWSLSMLLPTGTELFTASGPPTAVVAAVPDWAPWISRMPFERDLRLVFTEVDGRCRTTGGKIRSRPTDTGWLRHWCGDGGAAKAVREGGVVTVYGRGYQLVLVVPA
jgi:hypothetical protein